MRSSHLAGIQQLVFAGRADNPPRARRLPPIGACASCCRRSKLRNRFPRWSAAWIVYLGTAERKAASEPPDTPRARKRGGPMMVNRARIGHRDGFALATRPADWAKTAAIFSVPRPSRCRFGRRWYRAQLGEIGAGSGWGHGWSRIFVCCGISGALLKDPSQTSVFRKKADIYFCDKSEATIRPAWQSRWIAER